MPISIDLRKRVVSSINDGMRITKAAKIFKVSRRAIYNWFDLKEKTSSLAPKSGYQKGHSHKVKDWEEFKLFAAANKHRTIKEMVIVWEKQNNVTISQSAMERSLKKISYTSKKKLFDTKKQMKKNANVF
jgi:transposase